MYTQKQLDTLSLALIEEKTLEDLAVQKIAIHPLDSKVYVYAYSSKLGDIKKETTLNEVLSNGLFS